MDKPLPSLPYAHLSRISPLPLPRSSPTWTAWLLSTSITPLTYTIFLTSCLLILLSTLQIICEVHLFHAFNNTRVQLPGSSLAEWLFIPTTPVNLDSGPTAGNLLVASWGIMTSVVALIWVGCLWRETIAQRTRALAQTAFSLTLLHTALALAVLTYIFVAESSNSMPTYVTDWKTVSFTREYYICTAFPSRIRDVDRYWGFAACEDAQIGRWCMIGQASLSLVLSACCVVQAQRNAVLTFKRANGSDVEKAAGRAHAWRARGKGRAGVEVERREMGQRVMGNGLVGTAAIVTAHPVYRSSPDVASMRLLSS
ncbi:hypothetical protein K491DRAFT_780195 [Lophiostoma macrostomum CBS 122681]|uniref:Uncharacterized protein n=1 Tax=Lophiostoma macrostomum CBS 122681 TaxID=1314788 RepID=A0A6A6T0X1_9PLEO|nr:hypothetical protein K491DRAFT_780195 [Lophiostoma macrostomum CBS 122681]